jgi:hypothetical protein
MSLEQNARVETLVANDYHNFFRRPKPSRPEP